MMMPPDMVLFDCDGVLVDSEALTMQVIRNSLDQHGLTLTHEALVEISLGGTLPGLADSARALGARLPPSWVEDTYREVFDVLAEGVEPINGIQAVLDALDAACVSYAVGSNGPHRKMAITLGRTGLLSRFEGRIYSREDVPLPKPAPDVYLKAAMDAGVHPSRCVVIEDSPSGARAGQAAGMYCLGFAAETPAERLRPVCDEVFHAMTELPEILRL